MGKKSDLRKEYEQLMMEALEIIQMKLKPMPIFKIFEERDKAGRARFLRKWQRQQAALRPWQQPEQLFLITLEET